MAYANIFAFNRWTGGGFSLRIIKPGDDAIWADKSTIPAGVAGDADDDIVEEALRVGGMIVGLGEVGYFWPKHGMGLALELGGATVDDREGEDVCTFFDTICREYVG
jgi:hypothetical protein